MSPDLLIAEFQTWLQPLSSLLRLVNLLWGLGAATLLPALVFWLGGAERGFRAAWITAVSGCCNTLFKWVLAVPRPFLVSDAFTPLKLTDGYGMPSGNAQGPATLLLVLASKAPRWAWAVGVPLVVLAGVARIYYGVHSVDQVLAGWGLGLAIAWLAMAAEAPLVDRMRRLRPLHRVTAVLIATGLVFALFHGVAVWSLEAHPPPPEWKARWDQLAVELDELDESYSFVAPVEAGEIAGLALGYGVVGLIFLARGLPRLDNVAERWSAVAIGLAAYVAWSPAVRPAFRLLASVSEGIVFSLLAIPIVATLPLLLFVLVPSLARAVGARWPGG